MNAREIDVLLERHLFGREPTWVHTNGTLGRVTACDARHYSTTGDGMLLVVEAMRARGFDLEVVTRSGSERWLCQMWDAAPRVYPGREAHVEAASAPMAVALAALRALGVKGE